MAIDKEVLKTGARVLWWKALYQVMNYVSFINLTDIEFVVLINEKVW